jgi:hypothetical protein
MEEMAAPFDGHLLTAIDASAKCHGAFGME